MNSTMCTDVVRDSDPWISTHTLLPLGAVAVAHVHPLVIMLAVYAWESFEALLFNCWSDQYENIVNAITLDPLAGLAGIVAAAGLAGTQARRYVVPWSEVWQLAMLCSPTVLLWLQDPPSPALFTTAWCCMVFASFRTKSSDGTEPTPTVTRWGLVLFALVHTAIVSDTEWPHVRNVGLCMAVYIVHYAYEALLQPDTV